MGLGMVSSRACRKLNWRISSISISWRSETSRMVTSSESSRPSSSRTAAICTSPQRVSPLRLVNSNSLRKALPAPGAAWASRSSIRARMSDGRVICSGLDNSSSIGWSMKRAKAGLTSTGWRAGLRLTMPTAALSKMARKKASRFCRMSWLWRSAWVRRVILISSSMLASSSARRACCRCWRMPSSAAASWVTSRQGAVARAVFSQRHQRLAEAAGDADGDDHAESQRREGDQTEQQQVLRGDWDEVAFWCEYTEQDSAGVAVDRAEQAEQAAIRLVHGVQLAGRAGFHLPLLESGGKVGKFEFLGGLQQRLVDRRAIGKARVARRGDQLAFFQKQRSLALAAEGHPGGEFGDVDQPHVVADHVGRSIGAGPPHRGSDARFLGGEEDVRFGPVHAVVVGQGHGTLEPGTLAGVVVALAHLDRFDFAVLAPGDPVGLAAPFGRVADPVDPATVFGHQEQDFAAGFVGEDDRTDFAVVGDDREEEFVEAQQAGLVDVGVLAPALAAAQRHFDGLEQAGQAGFELLGGQLHLAFGQAGDGRPADQQVEAEREGGEREQDQQPVTGDQTVGETRLLEGNPVQHSFPLVWCAEVMVLYTFTAL